MSTRLSAFSPELQKEIQDIIFSLQAEPGIGGPCSRCELKPARKAVYRCLECFIHEPLCSACIVHSHLLQPFHHIEKWMDAFFMKISLNDIGHVIYLGHGGKRCPANMGDPNSFVVVHTNGVHQRSIHYCKCTKSAQTEDKTLQLINHRLFPPTVNVPQTAFTFDVLEHFHHHSLSAKTSSYDYFDALRRYTNAAFPRSVPVRP
jgi:hypothetical protein